MRRRDDIDELRAQVQAFVRGFGLLAGDRTPCGEPIGPSDAHALMVLRACALEGASPTQSALARRLGIDKSNVTRLCRRLERAGHLERRPCERDGRARRLALTARGHALAERLEAASRRRFAELLSAMPAAQRGAVIDALDALNRALDAERRKEEA